MTSPTTSVDRCTAPASQGARRAVRARAIPRVRKHRGRASPARNRSPRCRRPGAIVKDVSNRPDPNDATASLPTYDESKWPIFRVKMPPLALSAEAFQAHLDVCSERYRRGRPFCMLIDMADHPPLDALRRKAVGDRMMEDGQRYPRVMLGCALVVHTPASRGGVTAINWVAQPAYSFTAFDSMTAARMWLSHLLEQHRAGKI